MKSIYSIKSLPTAAILIVLAAYLFSGCTADTAVSENNTHNHSDAEVEVHDHSSTEKIVELTAQQYKLTDIVLGDFQMKNMSEVLNVNGYTKLPPQNQADVSVHVGGLIKSIRVLEGHCYIREPRVCQTTSILQVVKKQFNVFERRV